VCGWVFVRSRFHEPHFTNLVSLVFPARRNLRAMVQHAMTHFKSPDVMRFLGKKTHGGFTSQIVTSLRTGPKVFGLNIGSQKRPSPSPRLSKFFAPSTMPPPYPKCSMLYLTRQVCAATVMTCNDSSTPEELGPPLCPNIKRSSISRRPVCG
jgi:hypothetical protein